MKYIDAEKLKISLSDLAEHHKYYNGNFHDGVVFAVDEMIEDITSLQQEQPVLPGIEESGIPGKDFIPVEWVDACEQYGKWKIVQQEQQEKSKKDCNNCPHCVDRKDQYGWHFKGCFGGPYKGKFIAEIDKCPLEQEQPEVDLEKEIDAVWNPRFNLGWDEKSLLSINHSAFETIARHFYNIGLNARK